MKKKKWYLEYIEFLDHWGNNGGWKDVSFYYNQEGTKIRNLSVVAAGFVVAEDKDQLVVASHMDPNDGTCSGTIVIIKKTITKRKRIRV